MAGARQYRVAVPYVTLKVIDPMSGSWTFKGYYRDAVVAVDDVDPASLRHHVDGDMLVAVPAAEAPPEPAADPAPEPVAPAKSTKVKA